MSATATVSLPLRALRRALDRVERVLRPVEDVDPAPASVDVSDVDADLDSTTTRELLIPTRTDEPAAARASRQAQDYLERRRRKLSQQLEGR